MGEREGEGERERETEERNINQLYSICNSNRD